MTRPFVYVNMATSVDGKITSATRELPAMTSAYDRRQMDRLRASADAVLVGAGTMRADQPKLWIRDAEMREYRRSLGKDDGLLKIVVSASARLERDSRFFNDADGGGLLLITVEELPQQRLAELSACCEVWQLGRGQVDLAEACRRLKRRGVERLLVEGGGELNWQLIRNDLVDELHVTIAPTLLGGRDAPTLLEGSGLSMKQQKRLKLLSVHREADELYCRYGVER